MTLNIAEVRNRIAQRFPDVELVEDSVMRFTRTAHGRPFAVYYLDVAPTLPSTAEALTDYQDRVIGKYYFDGQKSLQWSNYLYFLVSPERLHEDATLKAKELIERDRSYARKCVITASELDAALQPPQLPTVEDTPSVSIHSVWLKKLAEAGLEDAVLSDGTLPTRLSLIETSSLAPQSTSQDIPQRQIAKALPFLQSLSLTDFRDFPAQRQFELGTVNLIFGVNGSGKTSLLEAIELFYCGRNKRNPRVDLPYRLDVVYTDGTEESATNDRALQTFRDRNLAWYGQSEVRTNDLYLSFGQFNFLDTDAAVAMAESTSLLEENLSKLLIGSQASKTWRKMERVRDALLGKVRELQPLQVQIQSELAVIEDQFKQAGSTEHESDSIGERMKDMVRRSGWSVPADNTEQFAASLVESLSEFASLAEQAVAIEWAAAPVSVNGLLKYCRETTDRCDRADKDIARLKLLRNEETQAAETIKRCQALEKLATDAERLIALGVPNLCSELARLTADIQKYRDALVGHDANRQAQPTNLVAAVALDEYSASVVARRGVLEAKLSSAKEEHANFAARRDHAMNLAQQLRQIAGEILQSSDKPDECPLCHSQFSRGQLSEHMQQGVEAGLEARAQQLLTELKTCEEELAANLEEERGTIWLIDFCNRRGLSYDVTVQEALAAVRTVLVELADAERRAEAVRAEIHAFESQGLTAAMLTEIPEALRDLGQSLKAWSKEDVAILRESIERAHGIAVGELEPARRNADELQREINALLQETESDIPTLQSSVSQLKERVATVESLVTRLDGILASFPWDSEKPLAELVVVVDSIRKVAGEFQSALGRERQSNAAIAEAAKRKEQLTTQINSLTPRLSRFSEAQTALHDILENHSLKDAMDSALKRHRAGIESIFARIHCPAEFSEVGEGFTTLVRKNNGSKATLSEISTGQRAALALSIFLAQNAQLSTAPPVVLIDDPIAHIDDLNSLSFLDYLRDLVLAGERQILFATASEKLASLFERKFDFLGAEQFRRHNLHRHPN